MMNKKRVLLVLLIAVSVSVFGQTYRQGPGYFNLMFASGSTVLNRDFAGNSAALEALSSAVSSNLAQIRAGRAHIEIVGHTIAGQNEANAVNATSVQASIVRALLKTQFNLGNESFTFGIDNTSRQENLIKVAVVNSPVANNANKEIFYTLSSNPAYLAAVMNNYGRVPYRSSVSEYELQQKAEMEREAREKELLARAEQQKREEELKRAQLEREAREKEQALRAEQERAERERAERLRAEQARAEQAKAEELARSASKTKRPNKFFRW